MSTEPEQPQGGFMQMMPAIAYTGSPEADSHAFLAQAKNLLHEYRRQIIAPLTDDDARTGVTSLLARFNGADKSKTTLPMTVLTIAGDALTLEVTAFEDSTELRFWTDNPHATHTWHDTAGVQSFIAHADGKTVAGVYAGELTAYNGFVVVFDGLGPNDYPGLRLELQTA